MTNLPEPTYWRKCSRCKAKINFNQKYWRCSVSSCNSKRTGLVFCSLACFEAHVPVMNHKDAGAFEERAPSLPEFRGEVKPKKAIPGTTPHEVLVVVSKVKSYIKSRSDFNCAASSMDALSDFVRREARSAIKNARQAGRKTVLERDFQ